MLLWWVTPAPALAPRTRVFSFPSLALELIGGSQLPRPPDDRNDEKNKRRTSIRSTGRGPRTLDHRPLNCDPRSPKFRTSDRPSVIATSLFEALAFPTSILEARFSPLGNSWAQGCTLGEEAGERRKGGGGRGRGGGGRKEREREEEAGREKRR